MTQQPKLIEIESFYVAGMQGEMTFSNNTTFDLWRAFKPRVNELSNRIGTDFYSLAIYPNGFFNAFNPSQSFSKMAGVKVSAHPQVPDEMVLLKVVSGTYAMFEHQGPSTEIFKDIFSHWLPNSGFKIGLRPHFEVLAENYQYNSPSASEQIYIPIEK